MKQTVAVVLAALLAAGCARAAAFSANVGIHPGQKQFTVSGQFVGSAGIDPATQPVTLRVGGFSATMPPGSFQRDPIGHFVFGGTINGARVAGTIWSKGDNQYAFGFTGRDAENLPTANPVDVQLSIGSNGGDASVNARFF